LSIYVNIEKKLGDFMLRVNFNTENDVLALMGKSGCGKSMTLKCIAGIEKPDRGTIIIDGVTLFSSDKKINLSPQKRKVGLLFQNYALFPNMTAFENIKAGANGIKNKEQKEAAVRAMMEKFEVLHLSNHYPHQLSGGQQQRIALARILVSEPECLLLDEPFSALDTHLRFITERETAKVIKDFGKTVILVSHNIEEVFRITDKIAVMNAGKIETFGEKNTVLSNPETINTALLTGWSEISPAEIINEKCIYAKDWGIILRIKQERCSDICKSKDNKDIGNENCDVRYFVSVRTETIRPAEEESDNSFQMKVESYAVNPYDTTLILKATEGSCPITWRVSNEWWLKNKTDFIRVHIPEEGVALLVDKR